MQRVLVVKLADLGDLLTATPALRALRLTWPAAEITALVTPHAAPLLEGNDAVDHVLTFPKALFDDPRSLVGPIRGPRAIAGGAKLASALRSARFDTVVLLHHLFTAWGRLKYRALLASTGAPVLAGLDNGRVDFLTHRAIDRGFGARHEVEYGLDVVGTLGATSPSPRMEIHLSEDELDAAEAAWAGANLHDRVVLHPGSGQFSLARRWEPARFAAVGDALAAEGLRVAVLAGPGEQDVANSVRSAMSAPSTLLSDLDVRAMAALLRRARLFVGNDSGVMHVAAAVGLPVVAVFGLSNYLAWGPYPSAAHEVIRLDLPCSPCLYRGAELGLRDGCALRSCLDELPVEPVIAAARRALAKPRIPAAAYATEFCRG